MIQAGFQFLSFAFAHWLGLYLLARNPRRALTGLAGIGLEAYALALAADVLLGQAPAAPPALLLARAHWLLTLLPAVFWTGALLHLLPAAGGLTAMAARAWRWGVLPFAALLAVAGLGTDLVVAPAGPLYPLFAAAALLPLLGGWALAIRSVQVARPRPARTFGLLLAATLFFGLGLGLFAFPLRWLPRSWAVLGITFDLLLLGLAVAVLDAFDEGEQLLPDLARSLASASAAALVFGGLAALIALPGEPVSARSVALLLAMVGAAIAMQTLFDPFQAALDRLAFARLPRLRRMRSELRATSSALARSGAAAEIDPASLPDEEFARLTRRSLSHLGDLPRLAASPLARLPLVQARLAARGAPDDTLERAAELKSLLVESIAQLKPRNKGDFGASDEWRHYNALYFPYVAGLKPYSRRDRPNGLAPAEREALEWFRASVPERTLHNWQNAAARLVAQNLRDQMT